MLGSHNFERSFNNIGMFYRVLIFILLIRKPIKVIFKDLLYVKFTSSKPGRELIWLYCRKSILIFLIWNRLYIFESISTHEVYFDLISVLISIALFFTHTILRGVIIINFQCFYVFLLEIQFLHLLFSMLFFYYRFHNHLHVHIILIINNLSYLLESESLVVL